MFANSVTSVYLSPVNDPFCIKVATANCDTLMGPTCRVNFPSRSIANHLAMIDLSETMIRSLVTVLWVDEPVWGNWAC